MRCAWSVYDTALRVAPPGALNSVTPPLRLGTIALDGLLPTRTGHPPFPPEGPQWDVLRTARPVRNFALRLRAVDCPDRQRHAGGNGLLQEAAACATISGYCPITRT